jgi:hypothetical protein
MKKDLFKQFQEAAKNAAVTHDVAPKLTVGEYQARITGVKTIKNINKNGEEIEGVQLFFETVKGTRASQKYFPRINWEESLKEMSEGRKPEDIPLLAILAKYGYVQDKIFESMFKDVTEVVTLPDFFTFINILIKEKELITIDVTAEAGKADPETGKVTEFKKIWFK